MCVPQGRDYKVDSMLPSSMLAASFIHLVTYFLQMCEVVRPLISLLDMERSALENFEALLALTNLASVNSTIR